MGLKSNMSAVFLVMFLNVQLLKVHAESTEKCMDGVYHKKKPSKESAAFKECHAWKDKSCCTANFTVELANHRVKNVWNFTWDHCSNMSQTCDKYLRNEECFFQCEPNLIKWHIGKAAIKGVPICSKYCDDWFDACKYDLTCVQNWVTDFNFSASSYTCPRKSKCQTFEDHYKNGEGLCNQMWGASFKYEKSSNCMVMDFTGANPNDNVKTKVVSSGQKVSKLHVVYVLFGLIISLGAAMHSTCM